MKTKGLINNRVLWIAALAAVVVLALSFALAARPALADESSSSSGSGESSASEAASESASAQVAGGLPMMGNDYVWFGNHLILSNAVIENDVIAAGQSVELRGCQVVGGMRIAAQETDIEGSSAQQNITVAGESVRIKNSQANAIAAACNIFSFNGSCSNLTVYASKVFIDGTVDGDVVVGAEEVEVGTNARIKGTLHVSSPRDPVMQRGAEVADVEYTQVEQGASASELTNELTALFSAFAIVMAVLGIIGTLLMALLAEWLFKRHTAAAAEMIKTRTGPTIGSGVVGALVAPLAIVILCLLVVTLPVAGVLTLALLAMSAAAGGFAGASVFKLAFPRLGRYPCALAGGAIVGVASAIPFLGSVVHAAAFMYFLGYVLQSIFLTIRKSDSPGVAYSSAGASSVPPGAIPTGEL